MRRFLSLLSFSFLFPLAACFDVDVTLTLPDETNAEMKTVMTASPEFYAMSSSGGEDLCEDGDGVVQDDGSYICSETMTGTIDELMSDPEIGEGMTIERRDGGLIYVAFDLGILTEDMAPPEGEDIADMEEMLREAFAGHGISVNVSGAEIIETNGTISDDGKMASYEIPLTIMFETETDLPETFNALVRPGS